MCFKISILGSGFENIDVLNICLNNFNPKLNNKLKDLSYKFNVKIEWVRSNKITYGDNDNNTND